MNSMMYNLSKKGWISWMQMMSLTGHRPFFFVCEKPTRVFSFTLGHFAPNLFAHFPYSTIMWVAKWERDLWWLSLFCESLKWEHFDHFLIERPPWHTIMESIIHMAHVHLMDVFFLLLAKVLKFKSSNSFSRRRFACQDPAWFSLSINVFLNPSLPCILKGKKLLKKTFLTVRWSTLIAESI